MSAQTNLENQLGFNPEKYTILIVDDTPTNLGVITDYLEDYNFDIMLARSGERALQSINYETPDIILLDVMMPGMNGFETCRQLKENPLTKDIPVIFMTALTGIDDKIKGFEAGAVDYITKPLQQKEVFARVTTHLKLHVLNKRLQTANGDLLKRNAQLEIMYQINQQITDAVALNVLLTNIVKLIQTTFNYYFVSIWLPGQTENMLAMTTGQGDTNTFSHQITTNTIPLNNKQSIIAFVYQNGQYHLANNVDQEPMYLPIKELSETKAELTLPLRIGPQVLGVLDIQSDQPAFFKPEDITMLQTITAQISIAIRSIQLFNLKV